MTSTTQGRLSLRQNFAWTFGSSVIASVARWGMFVGLTKLVSSEVVGQFALALAVATPITVFGQLQLRVALITDARDEHPFGAYLALRSAAVCASLLVALVVALASYGYSETAGLISVIAVCQLITSIRDMWDGLAQKHERMDITSIANVIDAVLSTIGFFAGLLLAESIIAAAAGLGLGRLLALTAYAIPRVRRLRRGKTSFALIWNRSELWRLFVVVIPLGLTTGLVSLNSNVPRYFIEELVDRKQLGYFSAIAYFLIAAQLFVGALGRAASPRLAILYRENIGRYVRLLVLLIAMGAAMGVIGITVASLAGDWFLSVFYTEEYAQASHIFVLLMVAGAAMFVNNFLGVGISAARFFRVQTATYLLVVLTTLASCALLIPRYGLDGAAYAAIISATVNALINAGVVIYVIRDAGAERAETAA